ncbi:ABC transporter [Corynebacterium sp. 13CS0277]|uniref:ABC transporter permease n=1 Tax=Corynebacterium sp. 13CS0277 TaxID=2071994 RepID=UPI000D0317F4|nr:ABC transporter permease [Corynebacterium sp. 13CS0277]PRQ10338.1 ABC transporter [Corynebacterium sp. 13CS0277]
MEATSVASASTPQLRPITRRQPIPTYLHQLWRRRFFINAEARAKAFSGYRNTLLGRAWLILAPLLDSAVYGVIFGFVLKTSRGIDHFLPYLLVGVTFFGFSSKALNGGAGLMRSRRNVVRAFAFPRAAIPLSHSLRDFYDSLPVMLMTMVAITIVPMGVKPTTMWAMLLPIVALQFLFNLGLVFFAAFITDVLPDLKTVLSYITRFWFYGSGVFFDLERLLENKTALDIAQANPAYIILDMARSVLVYDTMPPSSDWIRLSAWAAGTLVVGFVLFWSREVKYARG